MDNRIDKTIRFFEDGTCSYCNDALKRMKNEYFPNSAGKKSLDDIMAQIKKAGTGKKYDCIAGLSGGVDSTYVVYLGFRYGLKVLAVHVDDGLDAEIAVKNITSLCESTNTNLVMFRPDQEQYKDLIRSFFLARVPNIAVPQDNVIATALTETANRNELKYLLSGVNFAQECILERSVGVNAFDRKHITAIHKRFGRGGIDRLNLTGFYGRYIHKRYFSKMVHVLPLNLIDYNLNNVLTELADFCGYQYYGGKHYESILTRFLQCFYLPVKYGFDKRKSHFSSLIVSGQMTREEALAKLANDPYASKELKEYDFNFIADYLGMTRKEFDDLLALPAKQHQDYPVSVVNSYAGIARKLRKYLG
jgi:N-acetyl sugar amidotransferase